MMPMNRTECDCSQEMIWLNPHWKFVDDSGCWWRCIQFDRICQRNFRKSLKLVIFDVWGIGFCCELRIAAKVQLLEGTNSPIPQCNNNFKIEKRKRSSTRVRDKLSANEIKFELVEYTIHSNIDLNLAVIVIALQKLDRITLNSQHNQAEQSRKLHCSFAPLWLLTSAVRGSEFLIIDQSKGAPKRLDSILLRQRKSLHLSNLVE